MYNKIMKHLWAKITGAVVVFGSFLMFAAPAMASLLSGDGGTYNPTGQGSTGGVTLTDPLNGATFQTVVTNVTTFLFSYVAIPLCVIMVLVGAFQMMTSAGDPEKFGKGRKTLIYAAIGFAVAIIAGGITTLIQNIIGSGTAGGVNPTSQGSN
jgi:hypothetical protein